MALVSTLRAALLRVAPKTIEDNATLQERLRTGARGLVTFATGVKLIIAQDNPTMRQFWPSLGGMRPWEVVNGPDGFFVVHDAFQATPAARMLRRGDVVVRASGVSLMVNETYDDGADLLAQIAMCTPYEEKALATSLPPER